MATVSSTFGALAVTPKPYEFQSSAAGVGGFYSIAVTTGATVSLTANDPILSFRWTSATFNAILLRLNVASAVLSDITTRVNFGLEAVIARSFTASDTAGTASTMSSLQKMRTTFGNSVLGDLRVSTTAKLTAGTRTLDTSGFGSVYATPQPVVTNLGSCSLPLDIYNPITQGRYPLTIAQNEGFIVRCPVAMNTSGTVAFTFTIDWAEVPAISTF